MLELLERGLGGGYGRGDVVLRPLVVVEICCRLKHPGPATRDHLTFVVTHCRTVLFQVPAAIAAHLTIRKDTLDEEKEPYAAHLR